jgi:hypothetical protein
MSGFGGKADVGRLGLIDHFGVSPAKSGYGAMQGSSAGAD